MCEFCGYPVCPSTKKCGTCGFDFGICSEDPYADPSCPQCANRENADASEDFKKAMPELAREMRFNN